MTKSGCPSLDLEPYDSKLGRFYTECTEWRKNVIEHIARLRPSLIILSNSRGYFNDQSGQPQSLPRSLERTLKQLAPVSERIAVVYDTPWIERDAPDCLSHAAWLNRDPSVACRFSIPSQAEDPLHRSQDAVVAKFTNAFSVDMNNTICDRDECSVYENGITKFSDRHHLTKTYSLTLADDLEKKLRRFRD